MRRRISISTDTMQKMLDCFATEDEFVTFNEQLGNTISEIIFAAQVAHRNEDSAEVKTVMLMKQLFVFGMFCRENIEAIHELINAIEYKEAEEEDEDGFDATKYEWN